MIRYAYSADEISPDQLGGFFEGWANPPSRETHLQLLRKSDEVVVAIDETTGRLVGFITAITDHTLSAYIPFLEVLPQYRRKGIGTELVRHMLERLESMYMIDLVCDTQLQPLYVRLGMEPATGMMIRNYSRQSGMPPSADELNSRGHS